MKAFVKLRQDLIIPGVYFWIGRTHLLLPSSSWLCKGEVSTDTCVLLHSSRAALGTFFPALLRFWGCSSMEILLLSGQSARAKLGSHDTSEVQGSSPGPPSVLLPFPQNRNCSHVVNPISSGPNKNALH